MHLPEYVPVSLADFTTLPGPDIGIEPVVLKEQDALAPRGNAIVLNALTTPRLLKCVFRRLDL